MNWGIYEKRKKLIIWAFVLNLIIVLIAAVILPQMGRKLCDRSPYTKDKSRLKQIAFTVAFYYTDGGSTSYPLSPSKLDIDPSIIEKANQETWGSLNRTSPYYFFPDENSFYTGSKYKPIAIRKSPLRNRNKNLIIFEDAHLEEVSPQEAQFIIFFWKFIKDPITAIFFPIGFRKS